MTCDRFAKYTVLNHPHTYWRMRETLSSCVVLVQRLTKLRPGRYERPSSPSIQRKMKALKFFLMWLGYYEW